MRLAVVGSRSISIKNVEEYISKDVSEIVSGGARGVDSSATEYAKKKGIKLTVFLPEYSKYGKVAPLKRNEIIAEYADEVLAFWDGSSRGTKYTIEAFQKRGKPCRIIRVEI